MHRIAILTCVGLGLGLPGTVNADIPPPLPPAKQSVAIKIEVDEKAKGPRLVIPSGVFTPPRVRPGPKGVPQGAVDQPGADGVAANDDETQPHIHMVIAGIAVAMSLSCGGLWFVRRQGKGSARDLALLIAAGTSLTIGAVAWANPPAPPRPPVPSKQPAVNKIAAMPIAYDGKVDVDFVGGQEPVRLILDKESFEKLKKGDLKLPAPE
jgi:hypothetical protein